MIQTSCHCGAVKLQIDDELPKTLTLCNCSVCHRYGSLMAYFSPSKVQIFAEPDALQKYEWGDKGLAFIRCATCGCYSHWVANDPNLDRMGVNARLFENTDLGQIKVRRFDGKNTWKFLED